MKPNLSLYLHIPFCRKKCSYCDFISAPQSEEVQTKYISALCKEIDAWKDYLLNHTISTIFIGGGTPGILSERNMNILFTHLSTLNISSNLEFSMECNPESVTREKLHCMKEFGVNRISIGLQSTHDDELALLGRCHSYKDFLYSYENIRAEGFQNTNIDLMFSLPNQTPERYLQSLKKIIALKPEHISAYSLIIEDNTLLQKQIDEGIYALPSEDFYIDMYRQSIHLLRQNGYFQYEISNFSKPNFECKHNIVYWERQNYLGLGVSAASFIENRRFTNTSSIQEYQNHCTHSPDSILTASPISLEEEFEETIFLGLRMNKGLSLLKLKSDFPDFVNAVFFKTLESLESRNLMLRTSDDVISLTQKGIEISNQIFLELLM